MEEEQISVSAAVAQEWRGVGKDCNLSTDSEIGSFLLQLYYKENGGTGSGRGTVACIACKKLLSVALCPQCAVSYSSQTDHYSDRSDLACTSGIHSERVVIKTETAEEGEREDSLIVHREDLQAISCTGSSEPTSTPSRPWRTTTRGRKSVSDIPLTAEENSNHLVLKLERLDNASMISVWPSDADCTPPSLKTATASKHSRKNKSNVSAAAAKPSQSASKVTSGSKRCRKTKNRVRDEDYDPFEDEEDTEVDDDEPAVSVSRPKKTPKTSHKPGGGGGGEAAVGIPRPKKTLKTSHKPGGGGGDEAAVCIPRPKKTQKTSHKPGGGDGGEAVGIPRPKKRPKSSHKHGGGGCKAVNKQTVSTDKDSSPRKRQVFFMDPPDSDDAAMEALADFERMEEKREHVDPDYAPQKEEEEGAVESSDSDKEKIKKKPTVKLRKVGAFPCDICGAVFKENYLTQRHKRIHSDDHGKHCQYKCEQCKLPFWTKGLYVAHMRKHTGTKLFACAICDLEFTVGKLLKRHVLAQHGDLVSTVVRPGDIVSVSTQPCFKCVECGRGFTAYQRYRNHAYRHTMEKRHVCHVCSRGFVEPSLLVTHMRSHTGERPFTCCVCGARFKTAGALSGHMVRHTGERKYGCHLCPARYAKRQQLNGHLKSHTGEKSYLCQLCGNGYTERNTLRCHMRTHTGEKPFKCEICGKEFARPATFRNHKLRHTNIRPYQCIHCPMAFVDNSNYRRHNRLKHPDKPKLPTGKAGIRRNPQIFCYAKEDAGVGGSCPDNSGGGGGNVNDSVGGVVSTSGTLNSVGVSHTSNSGHANDGGGGGSKNTNAGGASYTSNSDNVNDGGVSSKASISGHLNSGGSVAHTSNNNKNVNFGGDGANMNVGGTNTSNNKNVNSGSGNGGGTTNDCGNSNSVSSNPAQANSVVNFSTTTIDPFKEFLKDQQHLFGGYGQGEGGGGRGVVEDREREKQGVSDEMERGDVHFGGRTFGSGQVLDSPARLAGDVARVLPGDVRMLPGDAEHLRQAELQEMLSRHPAQYHYHF